MPLIGYIYPLKDGRVPLSYTQALKLAGCDQVYNEGGTSPSARRVLKKIIGEICKDDTLLVVHIEQLANSLPRLNRIYDIIKAKGAAICILQGSSRGIPLTDTEDLQKEWAVVKARTPKTRPPGKKSVLRSRTKNNSKGSSDISKYFMEAKGEVRPSRRKAYMERLARSYHEWAPHVLHLRPSKTWKDVLTSINKDLSRDNQWTSRQLQYAVRAYVSMGLLPKETLLHDRLRRPGLELPAVDTAAIGADPDMGLKPTDDHLEGLHEETQRKHRNNF